MSSRTLAVNAPDYPGRLRDLPSPPSPMYLRGEVPPRLLVAIVGTRKPTPGAEAFAGSLAAALAREGVQICSGGARGIDTAAHLGCMKGGGRTWVIAPSSIDRPYPEDNAPLFEQIVGQGGGILSAYPPGTLARLPNFFERNAVLAALASVVVIVETALRGGARNAAAAARRLGRPVLVVPGAPWNPRASGCLVELRKGAGLVVSPADVVRALGLPDRPPPGTEGAESAPRTAHHSPLPIVPSRPLDPEGHLIVSAIQTGASHLDALCSSTGLPVARVQALLLTLTLDGIVVSDPSGRLSLVTQ